MKIYNLILLMVDIDIDNDTSVMVTAPLVGGT